MLATTDRTRNREVAPSSNAETANYYDQIAGEYDSYYLDAASLAENAIIGERVRLLLKSKANVLDLGCGTGLGLEMILNGGPLCDYVGVDISSEMIEVASKKHSSIASAKFLVGEMQSLPTLADNSFDVVISLFGGFSHASVFSDPTSEIYRVLKPGGTALIMTYSRYSAPRMIRWILTGNTAELSSVQPYRVRHDENHDTAAPARFFSPDELKSNFRFFSNVRVEGLNALIDPVLAGMIGRVNDLEAPMIQSRLELESRLLDDCPQLAHSLIVTARKS